MDSSNLSLNLSVTIDNQEEVFNSLKCFVDVLNNMPKYIVFNTQHGELKSSLEPMINTIVYDYFNNK